MSEQQLTPKGAYAGATLTSAEFTESPKTGTLQMLLKFNLAGSERWVFVALTDKTMGYDQNGDARIAQRQLDTLGYNGDDPPTFRTNENITLYCKNEPDLNGVMRDRWSVSTPWESTPAGQGKVGQFMSQYRAVSRMPTKPATKPTAPPASKPVGPPPATRRPTEKPYGKDEAWAQLVASGNEVSVPAWNEAVDKVADGREEGEFTSADWKKVVESYIPF